PAPGQDLDDILGRIKEFRQLRERWEELEDRGDRGRDRDREAEAQRRNGPDLRPGPGSGPPSGLYGPGGAGRPGAYGQAPGRSGAYGPPNPYGPSSPYDAWQGSPLAQGPYGQNVVQPGRQAQGSADRTTYVMWNPGLRPGVYAMDGAPGGAVRVEVLAADEVDRSRRRIEARREAEAAAAQAQEEAVQALEAMISPLRDLRYGLTYFSVVRGGVEAAQAQTGLATTVNDRLMRSLAALSPSSVTFASNDPWSRPKSGGDGAERLTTWTDPAWAEAEEEIRLYARDLQDLTRTVAPMSDFFAVKTRQLDRLRGQLLTALDRLRAARNQLRRPGVGPWPGEAGDGRAAGGEDRLRLYALAARLTEQTSYLKSAVAMDPLRPVIDAGRGATLMDLAERVDATARDLAAALAEGADNQSVSAADAAFESAWADWNAATGDAARPRAGSGWDGRIGQQKLLADDLTAGGDGVAEAAQRVELVHEALHDAVPRVGPRGDGGAGAVANAARTAERAATAFEAALPRADLRVLGGQSRDRFVAAIQQLSAATSYYVRIVEAAPIGSASERRARGVVEAAVTESFSGLEAIANSGRRDGAAAAARDLVNALETWRSAVRFAN
ncbi:hypothetical protein ACG2DA_14410, partial [Alienimonas sp. DA493]